jgi:hypothetical protein
MKNKLWIVVFIVGGIFGWLLSPSPDIPEPTVVETETIVYVNDTVTVYIEPEIFEPSVPDVVEETPQGLIRSTKTFETNFADIKVTALAECEVELFTIDLLNIKPMEVEIQHEIKTIEKIKTIVIEPSWYETRTTGIIIGVVGTLALVYASGQLVGK